MSASDSLADGAVDRYDTIVIVGGGCYGSYYVRQLERAARAGAITANELRVVDRSEACAVAANREALAGEGPIPIRLVEAEWSSFFARYLTESADASTSSRRDAIVPSPLMPHLMAEWLIDRARVRFGDRRVSTPAFERLPDVPWERAGAEGIHYVSFATWMCPVNCVEPRRCPHTRDERTWSLPIAMATHAERERAAGRELVSVALHCRHRAYGVGMFDTRDVVDADARITAAGAHGAADVTIGTVSHCHGALARLAIGPSPVGSQSA